MNEASTIIQNAAHEDANIIFGAVQDETMGDEVKITVIATGFREIPRSQQRPVEVHHSFATSHDNAMDFPDPVGPAEPVSPFPDSFPQPVRDEHRMAEATTVAMGHGLPK